MKRGWSRRGQSMSDEAIWFLAQLVGAVLLTVLLFNTIDNAFTGGSLAKQFYPGEIGLLLTAVAQSPDAMYIGVPIKKFGETEFTISGAKNVVDVSAAALRGSSRFWVFAPAGVGFDTFSIAPATGTVYAVKQGNDIAVHRKDEFNETLLTCPRINTTTRDWASLQHTIVTDDASRVTGTLIKVRLPRSTIASTVPSTTRQGATLALVAAAGRSDRVVVYYAPGGAGDIPTRGEKLGCLIINALQEEFGALEGAVLPTWLPLPLDGPAVRIVMSEGDDGALRKPERVQRALVAALEAFYG